VGIAVIFIQGCYCRLNTQIVGITG